MVFTMRLSVRHHNSLHVVEIKNLQFLSTLQSLPPKKKKIIPGMFFNKKNPLWLINRIATSIPFLLRNFRFTYAKLNQLNRSSVVGDNKTAYIGAPFFMGSPL
ncbi:hypothetical protein HanPSC8_Chr16g0712001 [Helianthus annuus]|nr:hypothetical protein HanPSC8_Chr16g0712001 [Helianthus annuus]